MASTKHDEPLEIGVAPPSYPAPVRYEPSPASPVYQVHHHHDLEHEHGCNHVHVHPHAHMHSHPRAAAPYAPAPACPLYGGMLLCYPPTDSFCPATGGPHISRRRQGCLSIFLSITTFPLGLIALPFDRKVACKKCGFVLREAWGNC